MNKSILVTEENVLIVAGTITVDEMTGYYYVKEEDCNFLPHLIRHDDVDVPDGVIGQKYCYTPAVGFYLNSNYVEPVIPIDAYEAGKIITGQQAQLNDMSIALATIMGV